METTSSLDATTEADDPNDYYEVSFTKVTKAKKGTLTASGKRTLEDDAGGDASSSSVMSEEEEDYKLDFNFKKTVWNKAMVL